MNAIYSSLVSPQGDVFKTVGGGHCIQFTEVETLKTRSDELTSPGRSVVCSMLRCRYHRNLAGVNVL